MGDLSRHYSHRDFACRCEDCTKKKKIRIHLGLVGILEELCAKYRRRIKIHSAYRCVTMADKTGTPRKGVHTLGRAVHIYLEGVTLPDLYRAVAAYPKIRGIGYYPDENMIHIDTREGEEREEWLKANGRTVDLTPDKKMEYGLLPIEAPTPVSGSSAPASGSAQQDSGPQPAGSSPPAS